MTFRKQAQQTIKAFRSDLNPTIYAFANSAKLNGTNEYLLSVLNDLEFLLSEQYESINDELIEVKYNLCEVAENSSDSNVSNTANETVQLIDSTLCEINTHQQSLNSIVYDIESQRSQTDSELILWDILADIFTALCDLARALTAHCVHLTNNYRLSVVDNFKTNYTVLFWVLHCIFITCIPNILKFLSTQYLIGLTLLAKGCVELYSNRKEIYSAATSTTDKVFSKVFCLV